MDPLTLNMEIGHYISAAEGKLNLFITETTILRVP